MKTTESSILSEKLDAIHALEQELKSLGVDLQLTDSGRRLLTKPEVLDQVSDYLHSMNDHHPWD